MGKIKINQIITAPFPRCFHGISCAHLPPAEDDTDGSRSRRRRSSRKAAAVIKLIKSDGGVKIYDRPIKAWELMEEYPKHLVCRSDCFYIGQITPALSDHDRLLPGNNYFLLPANFFQSALTFATLIRCRSAVPGKSPPFEVEKTASGGLRIKVTEEMVMQYQKAQAEAAAAAERIIGVCNTPQLRKDYELLVGRRLQWKPKLDTISEKKSQHKKMRKTKSSLL
ncbi:hypothetical protein ACS0TY_010731 [Phlomoides rotata]